MRVRFSTSITEINTITSSSEVFAIADFPTTYKTLRILGWTISKKINLTNYLVLIPDGDLFQLTWIDQSKIIAIDESSEPIEWLFLKKHMDQIPYYSKLKLNNLKCYEWMITNQGFFINIYDNNDYSRNLLYQNLPGILSKKQIVKYSQQQFYDNIQYLVSHGDEPELDLYTQDGKKYLVIAYSDFCDFYDENHNYHRLNKIEEIENHITFNDIVNIQGDFVDFERDIRDQSILVDGKLWFTLKSK